MTAGCLCNPLVIPISLGSDYDRCEERVVGNTDTCKQRACCRERRARRESLIKLSQNHYTPDLCLIKELGKGNIAREMVAESRNLESCKETIDKTGESLQSEVGFIYRMA